MMGEPRVHKAVSGFACECYRTKNSSKGCYECVQPRGPCFVRAVYRVNRCFFYFYKIKKSVVGR